MNRLFNPRLILPLTIFFGALILALCTGDLWQAVSSGKILRPEPAYAETAAKDDAEKHDAAKPAEAAAKPEETEKPASGADAAAADDVEEFSPGELEVLKQLASRRDELDRRAHDLDTREALIKVAEQRVDQKIKEMATLRLQMQSMVDQISGAQTTQLDNLVKIYETMKPKEAARIFETLDMHVLLGVIQRMKPARSAPIMAEMAPDKAKEITVALTKQDQLPQAK